MVVKLTFIKLLGGFMGTKKKPMPVKKGGKGSKGC